MTREEIFKAADEYANKHWIVGVNPNEHDNAREDFIAGAMLVKKSDSLPCVSLSLPDSKLIPALKDALMGYHKKINDGEYEYIQENDFEEIAEDLRAMLGNES